MKSSIFVFALFILTCQSSKSSARKMDSWRSEQFVPYIKECLGKMNLLFPIQPSYQITLSKNQVCLPPWLTIEKILPNTSSSLFTKKVEKVNQRPQLQQ